VKLQLVNDEGKVIDSLDVDEKDAAVIWGVLYEGYKQIGRKEDTEKVANGTTTS